MRDRSDDPSHHEQTFYHGAASCSSSIGCQKYDGKILRIQKVINSVKSCVKQNDQLSELKFGLNLTFF